jgi:hypothetical protein
MPRHFSEGINPNTGQYYYNERKPIPRQSGPTPAQASWWDSLSEGHRHLIEWHSRRYGRGLAHQRMILLQRFMRHMGEPNQKGDAMHQYAFEHIEEFKKFCESQTDIKP